MVVEIEKRYNLFFFIYLINQDERSANMNSSFILQWFSQRFKSIGILQYILHFPIN